MSESLSLLEALKADFAKRRRKENLLGVDVWVSPMTVEENTLLGEREPAGGPSRLAEVLLMKCTDAAGNPLFTRSDKDALIKCVAGEHIMRLVAWINGPGVDAQAKNSEAIADGSSPTA